VRKDAAEWRYFILPPPPVDYPAAASAEAFLYCFSDSLARMLLSFSLLFISLSFQPDDAG